MRGVPAFLALALTIVVMFVLAFAVERLVLRPLVNQPDIILFMATFGLTYFLIGFGELVFGGDPKVMITEQLLSAERLATISRCSAASCSCRRSTSRPRSSPR